jgi:hypothetical protein
MDLEQVHSRTLLVLLSISLNLRSKVFLEKKCFMPSWRTFAQCTLCIAYRVFSNSGCLQTRQRVLLVHTCTSSIPSWQSFYRISRDSVSSLCAFPCTGRPPRCSTTLRLLLESVNLSGVHSLHVLSDSAELRCALLVLATELPMFCCALLARPKEPRYKPTNSQTDSKIYL